MSKPNVWVVAADSYHMMDVFQTKEQATTKAEYLEKHFSFRCAPVEYVPAARVAELERALANAVSDNDRLTKAERAIEEIARTTGCNHTGDPDGQMQMVNCVQDVIRVAEERVAELEAEVRRLKAAIIEHRSQHGDDRCWKDHPKLYAVLGDGDLGDLRVGDKAAMLKNCARYIEHECEEGSPWVSYAELEAALARERAAGERLATFVSEWCSARFARKHLTVAEDLETAVTTYRHERSAT